MRQFISTGIRHLDNLLGGKGVDAESIILLRGEPGTGKTTLAFQIAKNIRENHLKFDDDEYCVIFVCIENKSDIALGKIISSFWPEKYENYVDFATKVGNWKSIDLNELIDTWIALAKEKASKDKLKSGDLNILLTDLWKKIVENNSKPLVVIIDSLDAMIYAAQHHFRNYDDRKMLLTIFNSFHSWWTDQIPKPTVLFTAEDTRGAVSKNAESYIADIVIELRQESTAYPIHLAHDLTVEWKENLSFCQVIKGRGLRTQRIPLCYEFVNNRGIEFFPTYAAQGLVSLYFENRPQLEVIQNIRRLDFPLSYPGIVVQEFTRPFLQRMFAVRRYQNRIPPRHPMLVSHVDEYWVEVLKEAKLLYPIPKEKLKLFSLSDEEENNTSIIPEIAEVKESIYIEKDLYLAVPQMGNVGMLVYRQDILDDLGCKTPQTWDDLEEICIELRNKNKKQYKFLIETRTYDTLLITALELGWSHGSFWRTIKDDDGKLRVIFEDADSFNRFVEAVSRIRDWIHKKHIMPGNSSVDPDYHDKMDWVFARHWYSTWIDVLTRQDGEDKKLMGDIDDNGIYDVAKLPISKDYRDRQVAASQQIEHHSGMGEWYLMIQNNSENIELGIDIINNLMTSRKVTERALSGVELPVIEKFYDLYGEAICFGTNKTYNYLRKEFFPHAKSRAMFAQYRTVARVLYGALRAVVTNGSVNVERLLIKAFEELDKDFKP